MPSVSPRTREIDVADDLSHGNRPFVGSSKTRGSERSQTSPQSDAKRIYEAQCASCHQSDGQGMPRAFPSLVGSRWVTGDEGRLIRILLHGMSGEVKVKGKTYNGMMPGWGARLSDQQVAAVASYVRTSWGNAAGTISREEVARVRRAVAGRRKPWTVEALRPAAGSDASEKRAETAATRDAVPLHPYPQEPPLMQRTFMPESSPSSIAVWLTDSLSYCFDAAYGMLRYAWRGGFIDNSEVREGHIPNERAALKGEVFYRNQTGFPLRIGDSRAEPDVDFIGYRMVDGLPQFEYTVDGAVVRERITSAPAGTGLVREFQVEGIDQPLRFVTSPQGGVKYRASAGTWHGDTLRLSPAEARQFTITMIDVGIQRKVAQGR